MEGWIFIVLFVIVFIGGSIYERIHKKNQFFATIRAEYGEVPKEYEHKLKEIAYYHEIVSKEIDHQEQIDEVTWNDLEMSYIFKRISTCVSFVGEQVLYSLLHLTYRKKEEAKIFEEMVRFYDENIEEREQTQYLLSGLGNLEISYFTPRFMMEMEQFIIKNIAIYKVLNRILIFSFLPVILLRNPTFFIIPIFVFFMNIVVYTMVKQKYDSEITILSHVMGVVKLANRLADSKKFSFESKFGLLREETKKFKIVLRKLSRISTRKTMSVQGDLFAIAYDYIIGGTMWDFIVYDRIIHQLKKNTKAYMKIYQTLGEIDVAISVASFRNSLVSYCIPEFHEGKEIEVMDLYHPLIQNPISNTIQLKKNCIITGSNASGKSTYIKALMVNLILANGINTCMATKARLPYTQVITSMAVRDDLMSNESYYIKEIKYMKRILQSLSEDRMVICAIDEILKGTNTGERVAASLAILKYLQKKNCLVIVASHDIEIAEALSEDFDNFHFRDQIMEHDILFDYKIYEGISKTKNAIRLLEYVGFPEEIVSDAKEIYGESYENKK